MGQNKISISFIRSRISERRNKRRLRALALTITAALIVTQVFPTLAENLTGGDPTISDTSTAIISPEPNVSDGAIEEESSEVAEDGENTEAVDASPSPTPSPTPLPPMATSSQEMLITLPGSLRVDPRATSVFMPQIQFVSNNALLVCIASSNLLFDLGSYRVSDDREEEYVLVKGDRTSFLLISGYPVFVNSLLNSQSGLRIYREGGAIGNHFALFRFVDLTKPAVEESLCLDGNQANNRFLTMVPLGLSQNISKAKVGLKKGG